MRLAAGIDARSAESSRVGPASVTRGLWPRVAKPEGIPVQARQDSLPDIDGQAFPVHRAVDSAGRLAGKWDWRSRSVRSRIDPGRETRADGTAVLEAVPVSALLPREIARLACLERCALSTAVNPECRLRQAARPLYPAGVRMVLLFCEYPRWVVHSLCPIDWCAEPAMPRYHRR